MKILAIYPWTHISSAALMMNGKLIAASPEERFTRTKWTTQFPIQSANWCLKQAKLQWKDIDRIVIPWNPSINISSASSRWDGNISWRGEMLSNIPLGRVAKESDVATAVAFLAADSSEMITGTSLVVDGGWTAQ